MVNLDQLRIFRAAAQSRSFTRAAEVVHLTQPGISKHIRQMEGYFGVPLFDRARRKVELTQAGEILFEATQEIMATIDTAERRIDDLKGLRGGRLRVGSSFPVGVYILPSVLAKFRKQYPGVELALEIMVSDAVGPKLLANEIDLGLVSSEVRDPRLSARPFFTDELVVIVPRSHPWAAKARLHVEDLVGETYVFAARGAGTRTVMEERLRAKSIVLPKVLDFGNLEGVKRAVEAGLGVSVQARSVVQRELAAGSLCTVKLSGIDTSIQFFSAWRKNAHLTHAAQALVELLESTGSPKTVKQRR
jgi:DNA-binding transcriptional LysR family regulator